MQSPVKAPVRRALSNVSEHLYGNIQGFFLGKSHKSLKSIICHNLSGSNGAKLSSRENHVATNERTKIKAALRFQSALFALYRMPVF